MKHSIRLPGSSIVVALAVLAGSVPGLAADAVQAPITVSECRGGIASVELMELANYKVTFRNTATVAADEIRFAIPYGRRKTATFDLHETFGPGVDITRSLKKTLSGGLYAYTSTQNTCNVDYVHFVDGSSWTRAAANTQAPA